MIDKNFKGFFYKQSKRVVFKLFYFYLGRRTNGLVGDMQVVTSSAIDVGNTSEFGMNYTHIINALLIGKEVVCVRLQPFFDYLKSTFYQLMLLCLSFFNSLNSLSSRFFLTLVYLYNVIIN